MWQISNLVGIVALILVFVVGGIGLLGTFGRVSSVTTKGFEFRSLILVRRFFAWSEIRRPAKLVRGAVGLIPRVEIMLTTASFFTFRRGFAVFVGKRDVDRHFVEELEQRVGLLNIEKFRDLLRK